MGGHNLSDAPGVAHVGGATNRRKEFLVAVSKKGKGAGRRWPDSQRR